MGALVGKCGKHYQEEQRKYKSCPATLLCFEETSLHCRNMGSISADMGGIMGHKFEPKWHEPI